MHHLGQIEKKLEPEKPLDFKQGFGHWVFTCKEYAYLLQGPDTF
jgi:hypothetical protein